MKTGRIFCLVAFLILIASCSREKGRHGGFPENVPVVTRQSGFDSVLIKYPYRIRVVDTVMYVTDLHGAGYFCHQYAYPSIKHQQSFSRKGKAPGELTDAVNIIVRRDGMVYMLDAFARKIYSWDGRNINLFMELPEELGRCMDFAMYNDSTFIVPDYLGDSRVAFVSNGKIVRRMGKVPVKEQAIPVVAVNQAWRPFMHYNPGNGILALVTQLGEVLEIYDLKNDATHKVIGPGGEPKFSLRGADASIEGIMGYGDVFVGDRYIYAIFWGHEMKKIRQREITVQGGNYIHVFDLEGNPVRRYELDRYITGFYVNETTGEVIGTDVNEDQLVMFNL